MNEDEGSVVIGPCGSEVMPSAADVSEAWGEAAERQVRCQHHTHQGGPKRSIGGLHDFRSQCAASTRRISIAPPTTTSNALPSICFSNRST